MKKKQVKTLLEKIEAENKRRGGYKKLTETQKNFLIGIHYIAFYIAGVITFITYLWRWIKALWSWIF